MNLGTLLGGFDLNKAINAVSNMFWSVFYRIWLLLANICDILESAFRKLAGVDPDVYIDPSKLTATSPEAEAANAANAAASSGKSDLISILISNPVVKQAFMSIMIVAIALIMFFTIIQIIREQYRDKDGGDPYKIVFRMFKGMITMLFVTAVVLVGFMVSGYVLNALDTATHPNGSRGTTTGAIFSAMVSNANKVRNGILQKSSITNTKLDSFSAQNDQGTIERTGGDNWIENQNIYENLYDFATKDDPNPVNQLLFTKKRIETVNNGICYIPFISGDDCTYAQFSFQWYEPHMAPGLDNKFAGYFLPVNAISSLPNVTGGSPMKTYMSDAFYGGGFTSLIPGSGLFIPGGISTDYFDAHSFSDFMKSYFAWAAICDAMQSMQSLIWNLYQGTGLGQAITTVINLPNVLSNVFGNGQPKQYWVFIMALIKYFMQYMGCPVKFDYTASRTYGSNFDFATEVGKFFIKNLPKLVLDDKSGYAAGMGVGNIGAAVGQMATEACQIIQKTLNDSLAGVDNFTFLVPAPTADTMLGSYNVMQYQQHLQDYQTVKTYNRIAGGTDFDANTEAQVSRAIEDDFEIGKLPSGMSRVSDERAAEIFPAANAVYTIDGTSSGIASLASIDIKTAIPKNFSNMNNDQVADEVDRLMSMGLDDADGMYLSIGTSNISVTGGLVVSPSGELVSGNAENNPYWSTAGNVKANYLNYYAVDVLYSFSKMDFIIGFVGIFIVIGVFVGFAFALIQRILELIVLYIMSPITLAMYPFDNGERFSSTFAQPFYKKVISVYSIIISMNLFLLVFPLFENIKFFGKYNKETPPKFVNETDLDPIKNKIMSVFIMLAMISLLPRIRGTIETMLGAEGLQDKSLKDVASGAWKEMQKGGAGLAVKGAGFVGRSAVSLRDQMRAGDWRENREKKKKAREAWEKEHPGENYNSLKNRRERIKEKGGLLKAANAAFQGTMGQALGRALLNGETGTLRQGKGWLGEKGKKYFGAKASKARLDKINKDREDLNKIKASKMAATKKETGDLVESAKDMGTKAAVLDLKKTGQESVNEARGKAQSARVAQGQALADVLQEKDVGKTEKGKEMIKALQAGKRDEAMKLAADVFGSDPEGKKKSDALQQAFKGNTEALKKAYNITDEKSLGKLADANMHAETEANAKDYEDAFNRHEQSRRNLRAAGNNESQINDLVKYNSLANGVGANQIQKFLSGESDAKDLDPEALKALQKVNSSIKSEGRVSFSEAEQASIAQKVHRQYQNKYQSTVDGLNQGKIFDLDQATKQSERLMGIYTTEMGGENTKKINLAYNQAGHETMEAYVSSKGHMKAMLNKDIVGEKRDLMKIRETGSVEGTMFEDDPKMAALCKTVAGKKSIEKLIYADEQMGDPSGFMGDASYESVDNAVGYVSWIGTVKNQRDMLISQADRHDQNAAQKSLEFDAAAKHIGKLDTLTTEYSYTEKNEQGELIEKKISLLAKDSDHAKNIAKIKERISNGEKDIALDSQVMENLQKASKEVQKQYDSIPPTQQNDALRRALSEQLEELGELTQTSSVGCVEDKNGATKRGQGEQMNTSLNNDMKFVNLEKINAEGNK